MASTKKCSTKITSTFSLEITNSSKIEVRDISWFLSKSWWSWSARSCARVRTASARFQAFLSVSVLVSSQCWWSDWEILFRVMIDNECNILNNMSRQDFRECRSLLIDMVLHTGRTDVWQEYVLTSSYFQTCRCISLSWSRWRQSLPAVTTVPALTRGGYWASCFTPVTSPTQQRPGVSTTSGPPGACRSSSSRGTRRGSWAWSSRRSVTDTTPWSLSLRLVSILSLCGRWSYRLLLLPGFIDFIVIPTLSTCGEMIATVLGTSAADFQQPWSETLLQNRNNWQKKVSAGENVQFQCMTTQADEGERGIDTSDASQDPRPPRASYCGCKHKHSVSTREPE